MSVTYAALGMKPQSDYNRNIYLDILDYTRQDKNWRAVIMRWKGIGGLERTSGGSGDWYRCPYHSIWILNKRWRVRNALYIDKLKRTLEICRKITASVPIDAGEIEDVTKAVVASVKEDILSLVGATDFRIVAENGEGNEVPGQGVCTSFILNIPGREQPLGEVHLYSEHK